MKVSETLNERRDPPTQTEGKLADRDFILAFLGLFALAAVYHILIPTLPIYLSRLGSTEVEVGALIGIFGFSSLILRPFVGSALRTRSEKKFMIAGALLYAFTSLAYLFMSPFWPFLTVRILQGVGFACFHTASFTFVAGRTLSSRRGESLSFFILAFNIAGVLAPPVGMFMVNSVGFSPLFLLCAGLAVCSLLITSRMGGQDLQRKESSVENRFFLSRKALFPSVIGAFSLFIWGALSAFFPLYAIRQGVTNPGVFFTVTGIMLVLGRGLGGKLLDRWSRERIILPCLATHFISIALLALSNTQPMFILVAVIWGLGQAFLIPALVVYALDRAGSPGAAMGTFLAITDLGFSLGPVVMGMILHLSNYPTMFICLALTGLVNFTYFYFFAWKRVQP